MQWTCTILYLCLASCGTLVTAQSSTEPPAANLTQATAGTGSDEAPTEDLKKNYSSIENDKRRTEWKEMRAVKILEPHPTLKGEFWMVPGDTLLEPGMPCPSGTGTGGGGLEGQAGSSAPGSSEPEASADKKERRKRDDNSGSVGSAEGSGSGSGSEKEGSEHMDQDEPQGHEENARTVTIPKATVTDNCMKQSIAIHRYRYLTKAGVMDQFYMISDLTQALQCNTTSNVCDCMENGTSSHLIEGRNVCIKKGMVGNGEECIHHEECKEGKLCIFDATKSNEGEIEDPRRYCSASTLIRSSIILITVLSILIELLH